MFWRVALEACEDGSEPDDKYREGIVLEDRREGAHDLIAAANAMWGTIPQPGEVYTITPLRDTVRYRVGASGETLPV